MHVHLREPGFEADETIDSGTAAALAGGFTSVACIPNTNPPIDSPATIALVRERAARADHCNVFVIACVSRNREGKEFAEIGRLVEAGAVALQRRRRSGGRRRADAPCAGILPDVRQTDLEPCRGPRAFAKRRDARGARLARAGSARTARRGRGGDGPARHRPGRGDRRAAARHARLSGQERRGHPPGKKPRRPRDGRGRAAPLFARPTNASAGSIPISR